MTDSDRRDLLRDLALINRALERQCVRVLITVDEAEVLPGENLRAVVTASSDHLTHVLHQLSGL